LRGSQGSLVLRTEIRAGVHRRIDLPERRAHDCQQVQARELAGRRFQRVFVIRVVDVQPTATKHRDLQCGDLTLLHAELLEGLERACEPEWRAAPNCRQAVCNFVIRFFERLEFGLCAARHGC
jgi:hypothetical protein